MNAIKKSALAAAVLMSMGAGAAQAATVQYDFTGNFVMFSGYDPTFSDPAHVILNEDGGVDNYDGDPISGSMFIDSVTGAGTATMTPTITFFGEAWSATGITLQAMGMGAVNFSMLFNWGAVDGSTSCGVTNCDIGVTGTFQMMPDLSFVTTASSMPDGPFAGFQPTFNGQAVLVPEASTYGMMLAGLGLVGFAVRRRQQIAA